MSPLLKVTVSSPLFISPQGHGHAVYPLVYLPSMEDEDDDDDKKDADEANEEEIDPNDLLITGSADTSIKIWNLYSGECLQVRVRETKSERERERKD